MALRENENKWKITEALHYISYFIQTIHLFSSIMFNFGGIHYHLTFYTLFSQNKDIEY